MAVVRRKRRGSALIGILLAAVAIVGFCVLFFLLETGYETFYSAAYPVEYQALVERYAEQNELPRSLVYAVIRTESSFQPDATSNVGARGLMQLMPDAFDWVHMRMAGEEDVTFDDMYDPERNIEYGTYMLSLLLDEFDTVENALCAYHAGWGNVKKWLSDPQYSENGADLVEIPIDETRNYVNKVTEARQAYQSLYGYE